MEYRNFTVSEKRLAGRALGIIDRNEALVCVRALEARHGPGDARAKSRARAAFADSEGRVNPRVSHKDGAVSLTRTAPS